MASKKILMLLGDFSEDYEVMVPYQTFIMVGHTVHTICPDKKAGEVIRTTVGEFEEYQTYTEKLGHKFELNANFDDIKPEDYDGLLIPGGRAPEYIRMNQRVLDIVKHFADANKPIAVICHGQQVLAAAGVLKGRLCTAYPALKSDMLQAGAKWGEVDETLANVYVDGNLVSAAAWSGNSECIGKFLELLGTKIEP